MTIRLGLLLLLASGLAYAQETTTTTLLPRSHAYCLHEAVRAWATAHPGQDITPAQWREIQDTCQREQ